jgi:hypothetical protein
MSFVDDSAFTTDICVLSREAVSMAVDRLGHYFGQYTMLHVAYSSRDCLDKLSSHGLSDDRLPVSFGGTWAGCQPWSTCADSEHVLGPVNPNLPCLVRNALWSYSQTLSLGSSISSSFQDSASFSNEGLSSQATEMMADNKQSSQAIHKKSAASKGVMTEEEKTKKRKKNQEYAQRKRGKEKIEVEVLQGQCLELNRENASLCQEKIRLQQLVQAANGIVQSYENNTCTALGAGSSGMFQLLPRLPSLASSKPS